jgi:hypothetical protein
MTTLLERPLDRASRAPALPLGRPRRLTDGAALGLLGLLCAALVIATWGTWGDLAQDTGYDLLAGSRMAAGELPYADFTYFYGPLSPALLGGLFSVTGSGIGPAVGLGLALALAICGLTYAAARTLVAPAGALAAAALTAAAALGTGNTSFVLPHSLSAPLGVACGLAAIVALARRSAGGGLGWTAVAGAACGAAAVARPDAAVVAGAAALAWLAGRALNRHPSAADLGALAGPALAIPAVVYGALLTQVSFDRLVHDNLVPSGSLSQGAGQVLLVSAPGTLGSFAELAGRTLLYAAAAAALVVVAAHAARGRRWAQAALGAGALGFVAVLAARPELLRHHGLEAAYGWIPAGAVLAGGWLLWRGRRTGADPRNLDPKLPVALALCAALAVMAAKSYAAFFPFPARYSSQQAAYVMPFAAVFLAWLHTEVLGRRRGARAAGIAWLALLALASLVLTAGDAARETVKVRGPHGSLTAEPRDGAAYQAALDAILRETRPGDPILLAPQATALYVMSGRRDPLPELSLLPGALPTTGAEAAAVARLADVRLAIVDPRPYAEYGAGAFGGPDFYPQIGAWLRHDLGRRTALRGAGPDPRTLTAWRRSAP